MYMHNPVHIADANSWYSVLKYTSNMSKILFIYYKPSAMNAVEREVKYVETMERVTECEG